MGKTRAPAKVRLSGDSVTKYSPGSPYDLLIESPIKRPSWKPRSYDGKYPFPGTAIRYEDEYYEIIEIQEEKKGDVRYCLKTWDSKFPIRVQFAYDSDEVRKARTLLKQEAADQKATLSIYCLMPLIGLLPAKIQTELQNRYGISATVITLISAICFLIPSLFLCMLILLQAFTGITFLPVWVMPFYPLVFYVCFESFFRLLHVKTTSSPLGSFLPNLIYSFFRSVQTPEKPRATPEQANIHDVVTTLPNALQIKSSLPKEWNEKSVIEHEGGFYSVAACTMPTQTERRYLYHLEEAPVGGGYGKVVHYRPDEAWLKLREEEKNERQTYVQTFSFFWGLLPADQQLKLEEIYSFDCIKFTKATAAVVGLLGAVNIVVSLVNILTGGNLFGELLWFLPAVYFTYESYERWEKAARKNEPSGSILGRLLLPLSSRLINF